MALRITVEVSIVAPDGTPQVQALMGDLTVNPNPSDFRHEADIAVVTVKDLLDRAGAQIEGRLDDWAIAATKIYGERGE
jgi:hypothetical protein